MNAFELLQSWPSWAKAGSEVIFDSPAWAMPVRWGDNPCVLRRASGKYRDVLGIAIRLDDEENFIGLGNREAFPDLHRLWEVKENLPDALKLALVERECGPLFQIVENAARRQLTVVGVAPSARREGTTGFEVVAGNGNILASFDLKVTSDLIRAFGMLKFIDCNHPAISEQTRPAWAVYASFILTDEELAGLAPGDFLLLPEIANGTPKWLTAMPKDGMLTVAAPEPESLTFAQFANEELPPIPPPTALALFRRGECIAAGRLDTLSGQPAMAIEEIR